MTYSTCDLEPNEVNKRCKQSWLSLHWKGTSKSLLIILWSFCFHSALLVARILSILSAKFSQSFGILSGCALRIPLHSGTLRTYLRPQGYFDILRCCFDLVMNCETDYPGYLLPNSWMSMIEGVGYALPTFLEHFNKRTTKLCFHVILSKEAAWWSKGLFQTGWFGGGKEEHLQNPLTNSLCSNWLKKPLQPQGWGKPKTPLTWAALWHWFCWIAFCNFQSILRAPENLFEPHCQHFRTQSWLAAATPQKGPHHCNMGSLRLPSTQGPPIPQARDSLRRANFLQSRKAQGFPTWWLHSPIVFTHPLASLSGRNQARLATRLAMRHPCTCQTCNPATRKASV